MHTTRRDSGWQWAMLLVVALMASWYVFATWNERVPAILVIMRASACLRLLCLCLPQAVPLRWPDHHTFIGLQVRHGNTVAGTVICPGLRTEEERLGGGAGQCEGLHLVGQIAVHAHSCVPIRSMHATDQFQHSLGSRPRQQACRTLREVP